MYVPLEWFLIWRSGIETLWTDTCEALPVKDKEIGYTLQDFVRNCQGSL